MYPVLILREEACCLIILLFLYAASKSYDMGKDSSSFYKMLWFAIIHVVFDIVTVLTVNNTDVVPSWVNLVCHIIFYMSAILFSNEILHYVIKLCSPRKSRLLYRIGFIVPVLYLAAIPFLGIEYVQAKGTWSSAGLAAETGFAIAFLYFIASMVLMFCNWNKLKRSFRSVLLPVLSILIVFDVVQVFVREILFTGACISIVTIAFFFSLENPIHVFERKLNTDTMTGFSSRNSFEAEIVPMEQEFKAAPSGDFIFAYCDINNLRTVNNRYGHSEGDRYIIFIAEKLTSGLTLVDRIYRMGGDEFLAVFYKKELDDVISELDAVRSACSVPGHGMDYQTGIAIGYAVSGKEYDSLRDVMRTADFYMYRNKNKTKKNELVKGSALNLTGLTDKLFDAMCFSSDKSYPFLTNINTGVTRISPKWVEYFGLPSEFFTDFNSTWLQIIHPDDRQHFVDDITATMTGKQPYHSCEYRAKNLDGEYVLCTCQGAIYHDLDGETDYFSGSLINHGIQESVDQITGLRNYTVLTEKVRTILEMRDSAILMKLGINNFNRINMLYGYAGGNKVLKTTGSMLKDSVDGFGEVFCQDGINFTILLQNIGRKKIKALCDSLSALFSKGIVIDDTPFIMDVSCGALEIGSDYMKASDRDYSTSIRNIQSSLLCALEESTYNKQGKIVFYDDMPAREGNSDYQLLKIIHQDATSEKKYFHMNYQAIAETKTGKIVGAEALLRWKHPDFGEVKPGFFIEFLENDPCYYDLGLFILDEALSAATEMRKLFPGFTINVNITALQLQHSDFVDSVLSMLDKYKFPHNSLVLELTERCKEMNADFLKDKIKEIRSHKIRVAFDDMGTGYSTIDLLLNIPIDEIKLDREFVSGIQANHNYRIFVEALARGVADGKYTLCFEGVESNEIRNYLTRFGPSLCQGYYFSKPVPKEDFRVKLEESCR